MNNYKITVLAENTTFIHNCLAQHGQSILIETDGYTLLFDVGEIPGAINHNLQQLGKSIEDIDDVVISHRHIDHIGGIFPVLEKMTHQRLLLPEQMGEPHYKQHPQKYNFLISDNQDRYNIAINQEDSDKLFTYEHAEVVSDDGIELHRNLYSTGCVGDWMREQAIVIDQHELGITVIVGCSHPTVETLIEKAQLVTGNNKVRGIIGGMHYTDFSLEEMKSRAQNLNDLGVEFVVPGHCTTVQGSEVLQSVLGDKVMLSKTHTFAAGNSIVVGDEVVTEFV